MLVLGGKHMGNTKQYYEEHRQEFIDRAIAWRKANPEQHRLNKRKGALKKLGWTPELEASVLVAQAHRCSICNAIFKGTPDADHEHTSPPKPRGLLCNFCNRGLGCFMDDPKLLDLAAAYLRKWGKV
jgi:hypothetical protein